uniref:Uncharacterized protein n=4 Tax=Aegilops tauschii subsp. strangulata TaxID=200361 RepID=A0A453JHR3_AEGTS
TQIPHLPHLIHSHTAHPRFRSDRDPFHRRPPFHPPLLSSAVHPCGGRSSLIAIVPLSFPLTLSGQTQSTRHRALAPPTAAWIPWTCAPSVSPARHRRLAWLPLVPPRHQARLRCHPGNPGSILQLINSSMDRSASRFVPCLAILLDFPYSLSSYPEDVQFRGMEMITNVSEYWKLAREKLLKMVYDYYASDAEDQWKLNENREAFSRILIWMTI